MRIALSLVLVLMAIVASGIAYADYYKVNVRRVDQDLYKTLDGYYIQTAYCYEYTYGDDAVLKYDQYSYDNRLIFSSGTSCDVVKIFK